MDRTFYTPTSRRIVTSVAAAMIRSANRTAYHADNVPSQVIAWTEKRHGNAAPDIRIRATFDELASIR